jgi:CMP-N,N'-diacetyllegionaminic acid synthase
LIDGRRVLVVVPARGGSKGVPLKNIRPLAGIPLIGHVGRLVRTLSFVDRAVVSTDSAEIAAAAREWGLDAPFIRPDSLSGDIISDLDVLTHAIETMEAIDKSRYDVVIMLQPTSPLRRREDVADAARKLVQEDWDAVWTVSPTDIKYHPLKQLTIGVDGRMDYFDPRGATIIARQQLDPVYHRNGAAYVLTRECILEQRAILGRRTTAIVTKTRMISIDTLDDFLAVEQEMSQRL